MAQKTINHQYLERLNSLFRAREFQQILDIARPLFGNPLILTSVTYTVLAITDEPEISSPNWLYIRDSGGIPVNALSFERLSSIYRKSIETGLPVLDGSADDGLFMLRKTLSSGNTILGYLDSPLYFGEPTEDDTALFNLVGDLISVKMYRDKDRPEPPDNMFEYFVFDLLEGRLSDPVLIEERLRFFKWDILKKGKLQVISIHYRTGTPDVSSIHAGKLAERLKVTFPHYRIVVYGAEFKTLCPISESLSYDKSLISSLETFLDGESMVAGISRPSDDLSVLCDYNRQARTAARLGQVFKPDRLIHFYDDYAIYHALDLCANDIEIIQFCHSAINVLRKYDRAHETKLLDSLRVYLSHYRSIGESASVLYIHRNTMNYRISKINELTNIDLSNPDVLCHLLFSFYAIDFMENKQKLPNTKHS